MLKVGCCSLNHFNPKHLINPVWKEEYASRLQAYASLFDILEIDSTFYKLPRKATAARWVEEAKTINKEFEFILKASREITHVHAFNEESIIYLKKFLKLAKIMKTKKILFQTGTEFEFNEGNLKKIKEFFVRIKNYEIIWEPRGTWLTKGYSELLGLCKKERIILCTDILKIAPEIDQEFNYFKLNGFGKNMLYNYDFSEAELKMVRKRIIEYKNDTYILFNNTYMYENALKLMKL